MTSTTLQAQARALGDPTRHAIFRHLADATAPVGVAELNEHFPLNHNAIRQHLAKLVAADLVVESRATPSGRGRPRLVYEIDPSAESRWGATGPYERLSRFLVEIIASGDTPQQVGRRVADQFRVPSPSDDAVTDVAAAMARQGFDPEVHATRHGAEVVLRDCPFASAAIGDRRTVCSLHLGIVEGLTRGSEVTVDELVARDPRTAGCQVRLTVGDEPAAEPEDATLTLRGRVPRR